MRRRFATWNCLVATFLRPWLVSYWSLIQSLAPWTDKPWVLIPQLQLCGRSNGWLLQVSMRRFQGSSRGYDEVLEWMTVAMHDASGLRVESRRSRGRRRDRCSARNDRSEDTVAICCGVRRDGLCNARCIGWVGRTNDPCTPQRYRFV